MIIPAFCPSGSVGTIMPERLYQEARSTFVDFGGMDLYNWSMDHLPSLKLTVSHLEMDAWKTSFLWDGLFREAMLVSVSVNISSVRKRHLHFRRLLGRFTSDVFVQIPTARRNNIWRWRLRSDRRLKLKNWRSITKRREVVRLPLAVEWAGSCQVVIPCNQNHV